MPTTRRERQPVDYTGNGYTTTFGVVTPRPYSLVGSQVTDSEGHPWFMKPRPAGDLGGPFYTRRIYWDHVSHPSVDASAPNRNAVDTLLLAKGGLNLALLPQNFTDYASSDATLKELGTTAIAEASPLAEKTSLVQMLGELARDGLPSIIGLNALKGKGGPKGLANEHLNYQFGVKPLWNDVKGLYETTIRMNEIVSQLNRDSGRVVRRKREFPVDRRTISNTTVAGQFPSTDLSTAYWNVDKGTLNTRITVEQRRWFSGAFTYYLPESDSGLSIARRAQTAEQLLGLVPDPADLWALMPWSWLVDWFSNAGDVIQNATNAYQYGLVMPYAYMMEETIVTYAYTMTGLSLKSGGPGVVTTRIKDHTKKRVKASPFGFGLDWDGFNPYQLSILGALGITRAPHRAR